MKRLKHWFMIGLMFFSFQNNAYAWFGTDAALMIPYLIKIIAEAVRQYQQLKSLSETTSQYKDLLDRYHRGLEEALRLLEGLPIKDDNILGAIKGFREAVAKIEDVYGKVPNSPETTMLKLHDDTVAESVKLVTALKEYADKQEQNANAAMVYAKDASPKGAARVTVETNAAILHTLNQLLRVNGQMLKTLSENLAFANKGGKDSVLHYNQVNRDMQKSLKEFNGDFKTPNFD